MNLLHVAYMARIRQKDVESIMTSFNDVRDIVILYETLPTRKVFRKDALTLSLGEQLFGCSGLVMTPLLQCWVETETQLKICDESMKSFAETDINGEILFEPKQTCVNF